jgi:hypothetical protein
MTTYESELKTISSSEEVVFNILSDLNNLGKLNDNTSLTDKIKDLEFDTDSCSFAVNGFGRVGLRIIERTPLNNIKMASENAPVSFNIDIYIHQIAENQTTLQLMLNAKLPATIKMMVGNKLQEGVNAIADLLAKSLNQ